MNIFFIILDIIIPGYSHTTPGKTIDIVLILGTGIIVVIFLTIFLLLCFLLRDRISQRQLFILFLLFLVFFFLCNSIELIFHIQQYYHPLGI
jgi:apolipoprotein N-acyltransferase